MMADLLKRRLFKTIIFIALIRFELLLIPNPLSSSMFLTLNKDDKSYCHLEFSGREPVEVIEYRNGYNTRFITYSYYNYSRNEYVDTFMTITLFVNNYFNIFLNGTGVYSANNNPPTVFNFIGIRYD